MKKAAIHQPHYFPYPGFFHKLSLADVFVIMDDTQYDKRFTNRNRILDPHGEVWLSVPIDKSDRFSPVRKVRINNSLPWREDHWKKLRVSYANSSYFKLYADELKKFYDTEWDMLFDLDLETTKKVLEWLGMRLPVVLESQLDVHSTGTQRLVNICKSVGADVYVSGRGAREYMDEGIFAVNGIKLEYQQYAPLPYPQRFGAVGGTGDSSASSFVPDLSVLDMLFNVGPAASSLIIGSNQDTLEAKLALSK